MPLMRLVCTLIEIPRVEFRKDLLNATSFLTKAQVNQEYAEDYYETTNY